MPNAIALPQYVYVQRVGRHTYYRFRRAGQPAKRIKEIPGTPAFQAAYDKLFTLSAVPPETYHDRSVRRYLLEDALVRTQRRAMENHLPFDLTAEYVGEMLTAQKHLCALTGIRFHLSRSGTRKATSRLPFRPSIDKIDPAKGYVQGNVRLLCFAVNMAVSDWGDDVFLEVCRAAVQQHRAPTTPGTGEKVVARKSPK